jgi:hypothetical protein
MAWFMAGAIHHGFFFSSHARKSDPSRSSARPLAKSATVLAVAGQTRARSAQRASSMCSIARPGSQRSQKGGRPVRPSSVAEPMNFNADGVTTVWISTPPWARREIAWQAL